MVMENIFGDILSDLGGGLVGGMGMASCGEIVDNHGLFQPVMEVRQILWVKIKQIRYNNF